MRVLPEIRGRRLPLHHCTHRADKLVDAHSELINAPIRLDTTLGKRNHRLIEAFDVVGQFIDTPRERIHTPGKRAHNGFKPGEAFIVLRLIIHEEFDGFLDIHRFHDTIGRGPERQGPSRMRLDEHFREK